MRTANMNLPRPAEVNPRGVKRKRTAAPEETCPYCHHIYSVRDGLSTKVDVDGNRWVLCNWAMQAIAPETSCLIAYALSGMTCLSQVDMESSNAVKGSHPALIVTTITVNDGLSTKG